MNDFDKRIEKMSKEFRVPETYHEKVDKVLETIREDAVPVPKKKTFMRSVVIVAAFCLLLVGAMSFSGGEVAEASFLGSFKQTILDFFGIDENESKEMGVESDKQEAVSKPDLMIKLENVVMDEQNIYAMIKITAPPEVEFKENMTFEYFGFCEGPNYDVATVLPGARSCTLLESLEGREHIATYVMSINTDEQVEEGKEITAFFNNLIDDPNVDNPEILVEGTWTLLFTSTRTDEKAVTIKGEEGMEYSLLDTTAKIKKIKLQPLGMTMVSDVSNIPAEVLNVSDTRITIRFKMIDGSELIVDSPNVEDEVIISSGSVSQYEKKGKTYNKYVCQFNNAINTDMVLGIYVGDCYVSLKEF